MNITEEQKNNILEECLNTKRTYRVIARENRVNYEDVIAIIEEYCQKRGYKSLGRKQNEDVFKRTMEKITEIEEWCKENERKPRGSILGVKVARKGEPETEKQKEIRLGRTLSTIRCTVLKRYEGKSLEKIENKGDRKIVERIRELEEKCKSSEKIENIQEER